MQLKEFWLILDIKKHNKNELFEVVQGDSYSNVVNISLVDGLVPFNLTNTLVEIIFKKSNGTTVLQNDVIFVNASQGKLQCTMKTNTIASPGQTVAEIRVLEGETLLTSTRFEFYVRKPLLNDETIESTNEFPILTQLINEVRLIEAQVPEEVLNNLNSLTTYVNGLAGAGRNAETIKGNADNIVLLQQEVDEHKADLASKQDWYDVFEKIKVQNSEAVMIQKTTDNQLNIFIHHYENFYQRWMLTRVDGLDNSVATHTNGNAWQVNSVKYTLVGTEDKNIASTEEVVKNGSWTNYSGTYTSTSAGAYMETTVFGEDVTLYGTFRNNGGLAQLTIDGKDFGVVDFYDISSGGVNKSILLASGLAKIDHVVRLTVLGTKNDLSSGTNIRINTISGMTKANLNVSGSSVFDVIFIPLPSNKDFRYGQSAIEIAINNTYVGNTVWSGTYHKYLHPTTLNNQKIYLDGIEKDIADFVVGTYYVCRDIMILQDLRLANGINEIADILMLEHFTKDGYHVKWNLEWTESVTINTSHSAMFGTSVDRLIFGDTQNVNIAIYDNEEHGDVDTFNMIGWQSQDDYLVAFKALNPSAMMFENTPKGMYYRDRVTDMKMYLHRFSGNVAIGDKWTSEFIVSIAKCNNVELIMR